MRTNVIQQCASSCAAMLIAAALLPANAVAAASAEFPSKPVRFIVPFPPGGTVDPLARLIGARLSNALGQQFIVERRRGPRAAADHQAGQRQRHPRSDRIGPGNRRRDDQHDRQHSAAEIKEPSPGPAFGPALPEFIGHACAPLSRPVPATLSRRLCDRGDQSRRKTTLAAQPVNRASMAAASP